MLKEQTNQYSVLSFIFKYMCRGNATWIHGDGAKVKHSGSRAVLLFFKFTNSYVCYGPLPVIREGGVHFPEKGF